VDSSQVMASEKWYMERGCRKSTDTPTSGGKLSAA